MRHETTYLVFRSDMLSHEHDEAQRVCDIMNQSEPS